MPVEIVGEIQNVETIATGTAIRDLARLRKAYGAGRLRKLKGIATAVMSINFRIVRMIVVFRRSEL